MGKSKKRLVICLFLLTIFLLQIVFIYPQEPTRPGAGEQQPIDYSDSQSVNDAIESGRTDIDWARVNQRIVNSDNIPRIPSWYVNVNEVQDQSRLITPQLTYNQNINQISDWNNLNQEARDSAISQLIGTDVITNTANQPTSGQITDDGFTFDNIAGLLIDESTLTNAVGVVYTKSTDTITAKHAGSYTAGGSITTNIKNLNAKHVNYYL